MSGSILEALAAARNPAEQAALIAEHAFSGLPDDASTVARRCVILHWFDQEIAAALAPITATAPAIGQRVFDQSAALPFIEKVPWGWAYHELTRAALLDDYAKRTPEVLVTGARLAAPIYAARQSQDLAIREALFCQIVAGDAGNAVATLDALLFAAGRRADWDSFAGVLALRDEAERLCFVKPLIREPRHWVAQGMACQAQGDITGHRTAYDQAIALTMQRRTSAETFIESLILLLETANEDMRDHIAGLLAGIEEPMFIQALLPLLESGSRWVKTSIAKMIELIAARDLSLARSCRNKLYSSLHNKVNDWHVRLAVINALAAIRELEVDTYPIVRLPRAITTIAINANETWQVRLAAIRLLGKIRSSQAVQVLDDILTPPNEDSKPPKPGPAGQVSDKPGQDMDRPSRHPGPNVASEADRERQRRMAVIEALGGIGRAKVGSGSRSARDVLKRLLADDDPLIRAAARQMLDRIQEAES